MSYDCKVETALDILVGKWKPIILYHLIKQGTLRFSELQRSIPDITKKMLTSQLRELEYCSPPDSLAVNRLYFATESGGSNFNILPTIA